MQIRQLILALAAAAALGACAASPWSASYESSGAPAPERPPHASVMLREVPWERLQQTLVDLQAERAASDVYPDEWPAERKAAAKERLLRGLQVSGDPAAIEVLGRSQFSTTSPIRPADGELEALARRVGATLVVWSRTYLGRTQTTMQEPVSGYTTASRNYRDKRGKWRSETYTEHSTIWVPVQVEADEHAWMAYFIRENDAVMMATPR